MFTHTSQLIASLGRACLHAFYAFFSPTSNNILATRRLVYIPRGWARCARSVSHSIWWFAHGICRWIPWSRQIVRKSKIVRVRLHVYVCVRCAQHLPLDSLAAANRKKEQNCACAWVCAFLCACMCARVFFAHRIYGWLLGRDQS